MKTTTLVSAYLILAGYICCARASETPTPTPTPEPVYLNVAIFSYIPEAAQIAENLQKKFHDYAQENGLNVHIDVTPIDPYTFPEKIDYDIYETDLCYIDKFKINGEYQLDPISNKPKSADDYVGPAKSIPTQEWANYVVPHWVCGNFLVFRSDNLKLKDAKSFTDILAAIQPVPNDGLDADLWGGAGLGEYYADALIDKAGPVKAREHLLKLGKLKEGDPEIAKQLDSSAVDALKALSAELPSRFYDYRKTLHNRNYVFPRAFADEEHSALLGYSERLYYFENENRDEPWKKAGYPTPADSLTVRQFSFGESSAGTPTWCDAFVVPKGKLGPKKKAIELFLTFITSEAGYTCLEEPDGEKNPASYLLPAYQNIYASDLVTKKMPILQSYQTALDGSFPIFDSQTYQGMTNAGGALKEVLGPTN